MAISQLGVNQQSNQGNQLQNLDGFEDSASQVAQSKDSDSYISPLHFPSQVTNVDNWADHVQYQEQSILQSNTIQQSDIIQPQLQLHQLPIDSLVEYISSDTSIATKLQKTKNKKKSSKKLQVDKH